jgi:diguanylate cyclase (GGDEF)-like protein
MLLRPFSRFRNIMVTQVFLINLSVIIFLIVAAIFMGIYIRSNDLMLETVRQQAESNFDLIVRVRLWNSNHEGVYVKKKKDDESNQYLKEAGIDPDIKCADGKVLTLRNPHFMTREISEKTLGNTKVYFHMVSLKPINPHNKPDVFEKSALEKFETGNKSFWQIDKSGKEPIFRYIAPLYVEESCLKCHGRSGYKAGDIRGGISINVPFGSVADAMQTNKLILIGVCILTIGMLLGIIFFMGWRLTVKLENAQKLLTEMATTDELTKLLNRREVMSRLNEEFHRAKRSSEGLGVILLDIDHFKRINDLYGHPFGDIVLKEVANRIRDSLRIYEIVGRIGGEEFLVISPDTDDERLKHLAERMRIAVKASQIGDEKNMVTVSISAGITVLNNEDPTPDILFSRSDKALYRAKNEGRDKVVLL